MANGHGGYRKPQHPAPASGPGRLAKRTDGGPTQAIREVPSQGGHRGDRQDITNLERSAPMPLDSGGGKAPIPPAPSKTAADVTPLNAPSNKPDEPVTAGADVGEGPGLESLGIKDPQTALSERDAQQLAQYLPVIEYWANQPGSLPSTRAWVRQVKGILAGLPT